MPKLQVNRKNTKTFDIQVFEGNNPMDISGYSLKFTVKPDLLDLDNDDVGALISKTLQTTSPVGIATIHLTTEDTSLDPATYFYDVKLNNASGKWVQSSIVDKFIIRPNITNE